MPESLKTSIFVPVRKHLHYGLATMIKTSPQELKAGIALVLIQPDHMVVNLFSNSLQFAGKATRYWEIFVPIRFFWACAALQSKANFLIEFEDGVIRLRILKFADPEIRVKHLLPAKVSNDFIGKIRCI